MVVGVRVMISTHSVFEQVLAAIGEVHCDVFLQQPTSETMIYEFSKLNNIISVFPLT